jgi:hypothetical protein
MVEKKKVNSDLKKNIFRVLKDSSKPLSTQDLSLELNKPWHSVHTRCLMLQVEGFVEGFRVGRINLWMTKEASK